MAEPSPSPDTGDHASVGPDRRSSTVYPGTPRWVKGFGVVVIVLVLLVIISMATGLGGGHGPGRHLPSSGGGPLPPSSLTARFVHQP
jgi:hypothetical protein